MPRAAINAQHISPLIIMKKIHNAFYYDHITIKKKYGLESLKKLPIIEWLVSRRTKDYKTDMFELKSRVLSTPLGIRSIVIILLIFYYVYAY